jgi:hypothetical protein
MHQIQWLEVQVADVSQAGTAGDGRSDAPSTRHAPCTPQPHRTALSEGHIRLAAHAFNKTPSEYAVQIYEYAVVALRLDTNL